MRARRTDYPPLSPEAAAAVAQLGEVLRSVPKVAEWAAHGGNVIAIYEQTPAQVAEREQRRRSAQDARNLRRIKQRAERKAGAR